MPGPLPLPHSLPAQCSPKEPAASYPSPEQAQMRQMLQSEKEGLSFSKSYRLLCLEVGGLGQPLPSELDN